MERALRSGHRTLVLGGDCTVELGWWRARSAPAVRAGLVYFDMHPDLNTPETIVGGTFDWMGVAHMLALPGTHPALSAPLLAPADLVLLAAEAAEMTEGEQRAIADHDLATIPLADVAADPHAAAGRALAALDHEHLLVHFDVDVVDFVDQPLSENTGLEHRPAVRHHADRARCVARRPARGNAHGHRAQPVPRRRRRVHNRGTRRRARRCAAGINQ